MRARIGKSNYMTEGSARADYRNDRVIRVDAVSGSVDGNMVVTIPGHHWLGWIEGSVCVSCQLQV